MSLLFSTLNSPQLVISFSRSKSLDVTHQTHCSGNWKSNFQVFLSAQWRNPSSPLSFPSLSIEGQDKCPLSQMHYSRFLAALLLLLLASFSHASQPLGIGCNVEGLSYYDADLKMCDQVHAASEFGVPEGPWKGSVPVDAEGWPMADFSVILYSGTPLSELWRVSGAGKAPTISPNACSVKVLNITHDPASDTFVAFVDTNAQVSVILTFAGTDAGVRNLSVWRTSCAEGATFHPAFLAHISRCTLLRFLDFAQINNDNKTSWAAEKPLAYPQWTAGGAPWGAAIALANAAGADVWINIPTLADDGYITSLASLLLEQLRPSAIIYTEFSNEVCVCVCVCVCCARHKPAWALPSSPPPLFLLFFFFLHAHAFFAHAPRANGHAHRWNFGFEQFHWQVALANASVLSQGDPYKLNYSNESNAFYWTNRLTAYQAGVRIPRLFKGIFGSAAVGRGARVRPVLAGQVAYSEPIVQGIRYLESVWGPPSVLLHAFAGAPYFGAGTENITTVPDLLARVASNVAGLHPSAGWGGGGGAQQHATLAAWYRVFFHGCALAAAFGCCLGFCFLFHCFCTATGFCWPLGCCCCCLTTSPPPPPLPAPPHTPTWVPRAIYMRHRTPPSGRRGGARLFWRGWQLLPLGRRAARPRLYAPNDAVLPQLGQLWQCGAAEPV
jgi:hypothetical protein